MNEAAQPAADLSDSQIHLLEHLLARRPAQAIAAEPSAIGPGVRVPLCSAQARIWFIEQIYPATALYSLCNRAELDDWPARPAVFDALRTMMDRHDALRLRIVEEQTEPSQEALSGLEPPLAWHDLRDLPAEEGLARAEEIAEKDARAPFQLDHPPLFRIAIILLPSGQALLLSVFHHIIMDGWSIGLFRQELVAILAGAPVAARPAIGYLDYVAWQSAQDEDFRAHLEYWQSKLGGELPVLDIPKDRPKHGSSVTFAGDLINFPIAHDLIRPMAGMAEAENTTRFAVLLAVFKILLFRLSGEEDIIVGAPFADRRHPSAEPLLGCFANMVPLRTVLNGSLTFREAVRRVRVTALEAYENQAPFDRLVKELRIARDLHHNPIFQVQFAYDNVSTMYELPGAKVCDREIRTGTSKFSLTLSIIETPSGLSGCMEYSTALFDQATIERYIGLYVRLLEILCQEPDTPIGEIELLSPEQRQHVLFGLNPHETPYHRYRTMAEPFEEQVERSPGAVALTGEEGQLTYHELNAHANRLAHFLRGTGVNRGSFVAVCMERSFSLIATLYAIAKSGAAYVPLDPELPPARIAFMLDDVRPSVVVVDRAFRSLIPDGPWQIVCQEEDAHLWHRYPTDNLACGGRSNHLVHLLYTSGSTGRPKAVAYSIEGAIAEIFWLHRFYPLAAGDANIFKTSYGFDVSIWEIFWSLYFGARLVMCKRGGHRDPRYLIDVIARNGVSTIFIIPSMLEAVLGELTHGDCPSLRWVFCGGAPVTPRLRDAFYEKASATLINCYGPTEAGCVTDMILPPDRGAPVVPLGRPAANYRFYILDAALKPVPIGVPGEAFIAGEIGLAQHYHNRPELTAERFLPDPFWPDGGRMYRTGDVCRYRENGVLEHLGRVGRQVKVRGMRVELAEIESIFCEHETVETCAVVCSDAADGARLVAFAVPSAGRAIVAEELLDHAGRLLPRHMVPTTVVGVARIPITINGKIDTQVLLKLAQELKPAGATNGVPAANQREKRLQCIFEQVLECEATGVTDSFFDLGGHSLMVFKLIAACEQEFHCRLSVVDVFSAPTVRGLLDRMQPPESHTEGCLVPLFVTPGRPIVVFVHAASGSVLPFFQAARFLSGEYSTYGLQPPSIEEGDSWIPIEDLAAEYVQALDAVRGLSPVVIAGWSMGGCVGLEMARQWQLQDVDVAALLMLDTFLPPRALDSQRDCETATSAILNMDVLGLEGFSAAEASHAAELFPRLQRVLGANRRSFIEYQPAWFNGDVEYLRAVDTFSGERSQLPSVYASSERGWTPHVRSIVVHETGGNHFNMVAAENARSLAETIRNIVQDRLAFSVI